MKGITPVIAIILLLLITISIVGFSSVFFSRTTQTAAEKGEEQLKQQVSQITSQFRIENINRNHVHIRNTGGSSINISSLGFYVDNKLVPVYGPGTLNPGEVGAYFLNDAELPDYTTTLRVSGAGLSDSLSVCLYCNYPRNFTAYWAFEENSGTIAHDTANDYNGTITGAEWVSGRFGRALSFDGIDDRVRIPNPLFGKYQNFTVEAWIKPNRIHTGTIIGDRVAGSANVWQFQYNDGTLYFNWGAAGNGTSVGTANEANVWFHVVLVVNGTSTGGRAKAWVNGVGGTAKPIDTLAAPGSVLWIGSYDTSQFFNGTIDEVKLWNYTLSDAEARSLYR